MKVLVTGATGFIGAHVAQTLLAGGDRVACLVRPSSNVERLRSLDVELVTGDARNEASLQAAVTDVDAVIHLAGLIKAFRLADLLEVNEQGVRNLFAACASRRTPPTVVHVSSLAAAGPSFGGRPRVESDVPNPVSNYGRSKRAGELVAEEFARHVPTSIVRPPIVFGEGDPTMLSMVRPIARFGVHAVPGRTERHVSLVHAADLAQLLVAVMRRGRRLPAEPSDNASAEGYYYAAAETHPDYAELGLLIGGALGRRRTWVLRLPEWTSWSAAAASEMWARVRRTPSIFNLDKIREATAGSWTCSADRARNELGFQARDPLPKRLASTVAWYRGTGWI